MQAKVQTYWQWIRYNESRVPAGKKLLRVNLDETCVSMAPESDAGLILIRSEPDAKSYISKHQSRTNLTYVATVCDDPALQKHMRGHVDKDGKTELEWAIGTRNERRALLARLAKGLRRALRNALARGSPASGLSRPVYSSLSL